MPTNNEIHFKDVLLQVHVNCNPLQKSYHLHNDIKGNSSSSFQVKAFPNKLLFFLSLTVPLLLLLKCKMCNLMGWALDE